MGSLWKRKVPISPTILVSVGRSRFRCPFYGFYKGQGFLVDQKGNQCGIFTSRHSPCSMEMNDKTPDWDSCPFNGEGIVSDVGKKITVVFAEEFESKGVRSWSGIKFQDWLEYVMDEKTRRP